MGGSAKPAKTLALPTLLSHALVAFTIEFDNEAEHQMPHRTSAHGRSHDSLPCPWLVSLAMWANCMQFVGEKGVRVGELEKMARTATNLNGMERWGYVIVAPDPDDKRPKPPHSDWVIRATPAGRKAQEIWRPLFGAIEERWRARFGTEAIDELRAALAAVLGQIDLELPECLPILGYGLWSSDRRQARRTPAASENPRRSDGLPLSALLSRALLAFAIEFENESDVSLAIGTNVLRILDEKGVSVRDLPTLSGVSKEAISTAMGILRKRGAAVEGAGPAGSRGKIVRLTRVGREDRDAHEKLVAAIEAKWDARFGAGLMQALRTSLERLVGGGTAETSPLFQGLEPYPDGWRADVRKASTLPRFPMVLHRGGFPDGS